MKVKLEYSTPSFHYNRFGRKYKFDNTLKYADVSMIITAWIDGNPSDSYFLKFQGTILPTLKIPLLAGSEKMTGLIKDWIAKSRRKDSKFKASKSRKWGNDIIYTSLKLDDIEKQVIKWATKKGCECGDDN